VIDDKEDSRMSMEELYPPKRMWGTGRHKTDGWRDASSDLLCHGSVETGKQIVLGILLIGFPCTSLKGERCRL